MERSRCYIIGFLILAMLGSCSKARVSLEELRRYSVAEENGLMKSVEYGDMKIKVMYRPVELLVSMDTSPQHVQNWEKELSYYYERHFFLMQLSIAGRDLETTFAERGNLEHVKNYLASGIADAISINIEDETVYPETVTYVSSFGNGPVSSLLISFGPDLKLNSEDFALLYQDKLLTNRAYQFPFAISDIVAIPEVRTE